ncbi:MAG: LUD domain-containing protein [Brevibacterium sp.]|uniref:LutC/YkgG family protein n=1 Tax=Brevibacterium sp. TaxID=1701 RepID=UPI0026494BFC|nr:LUD domain-containing protein [Brevibacterium sp.]MDN5806395.1 LUD domain-containing protein [Brevibacterium sp.]MDN5832845.1 LUD domain-containing protein [Brevibacterium sp.]MDN5875312.1 LUD domain-containing protein [Brevibacterium sp.]MDN5908026.1 LUD domain-containing protein [Brevibacterium sp.]MDN6122795.1 LUD domain-containing protein [Brevibacterium sp.]
MTDTAREEILGRINQALGRRGGGEYVSSSSGTVPAGSPTGGEGHSSAAEAPHAQPGAPAAGGGTVDQSADYFRTGTHEGEELIELLVDRLEDYKANVHRVSGDPAATIAGLIESGSAIVVPRGLDDSWLQDFTGEVSVDAPGQELSVPELDAQAAVVTASAVAIAQTGTIVLDGSPECGRRAITLVPDHHVCVVRVADIVDIVPEGVARLRPSAALTFISGPSATSDIELKRVEGVHGPRTLDVVIVDT